ncbi:phosphatase PAP2 family protein [Agromyces sp. M3QZ16-3]|uniref:phosphatase PAP2 family protein n=1 Tax=Agromyces sp. M3QZ16-3 TaxID=3447585 RepID=UPI003F68EA84
MRRVLRSFLLPGIGAIAVLAAAGRLVRLVGGDDPAEDRAVRGLQAASGHRPDDREGGGEVDAPVAQAGSRGSLDRFTAPVSWYSGVPQTIVNGALWWVVTWVLTRNPRAAVAPVAALALETACFVGAAALVGRPRPQGVWRPEPPHATSSFPSGHTAASVALHTTLADLMDRHEARGARALGPVLRYGIPGAVAFSRIHRGQHHITDTVAGLLLGRWSAAVVRRELL